MAPIDILILLVIAVAFVAVVLRVRKKGTCADCGSSGSCPSCGNGSGLRRLGRKKATCPACEGVDKVASKLGQGVK